MTTDSPASVVDVIERIDALLPTTVTTQIDTAYAGASLPLPRILWTPGTEAFFAPPNRGSAAQRPIYRLASSWQCQLWAGGGAVQDPLAALRALEALRDQVLSAIHAVARGNCTIAAGRFEPQGAEAGLQEGRAYTLTVTFQLEVLEASARFDLAHVTSVAVCPSEGGGAVSTQHQPTER